jgi:sugar lactone lactonase YvrE
VAGYGVAGGWQARFDREGVLAGDMGLNAPTGLALFGTRLLISDRYNQRIFEMNVLPGAGQLPPASQLHVLAGTGNRGFRGDGGLALHAEFNGPQALAVDRVRQRLYVADTDNRRVRVVHLQYDMGRGHPEVTIGTYAGNGEYASTGDGGPAVAGAIRYPTGLAVDEASGDLYIADAHSHCVRVARNDTGRIDMYIHGPSLGTYIRRIWGLAWHPDESALYFSSLEDHTIYGMDTALGPGLVHLAGTGGPGYTGDEPALAEEQTLFGPQAMVARPTGASSSRTRTTTASASAPPTG